MERRLAHALEFGSKSDLTTQILTYAFIAQLIGTALISFESVFKTSLLFFLEEENGISRTMTLGRLLHQIKCISASIGDRLIKMIDTDIRNSLRARHMAPFGSKKVDKYFWQLCYLDEVKEMPLHQFWTEIKKNKHYFDRFYAYSA